LPPGELLEGKPHEQFLWGGAGNGPNHVSGTAPVPYPAAEVRRFSSPGCLSDIDHFPRFIRATKAPARDSRLASNAVAQKGEGLFDKSGCATCHVETLTGTKINGGTFTIPAALGDR